MLEALVAFALSLQGPLQPLLEQFTYICDLLTPLKFEAIHEYLNAAASPEVPADVMRYMICLFGSFPIAALFALIPSPTIKHIFNVLLGVSIAQFVFGSTWVHTLIMALGTYLIVLMAPKHHIGKIAMFWNLIYLSFSHIYRMYVDYMGVTLEISGAQMVLCMKLTAFAFNYYDGAFDLKRLEVPTENKNLARIYATRRALCVKTLPSLLEFLSYSFCFPTFLAGPAFEFREFIDVVNGVKPAGPGRLVATLKKFAIGTSYLVLAMLLGPSFPQDSFFNESVAALPWYKQIPTLYITFFLFKCKFYSCWTVAEAATVLAGFGYEGQVDGKPQWNGVQYMNVWEFEFASCHRDSTRKWNKITQSWLERYIYSRTNNSLTATYFVSAFWHGFYPGYYLFFMLMPLPTLVNRTAHKRLRPWFLEVDGSSGTKKLVYDIVCGIANALSVHYIALPFITLGWNESIQAYINLNFSGHVILVVLLIALQFVPTRKDIKTKEE